MGNQQFLLLRDEPCRAIVHQRELLDLVSFGGNLLELLQARLKSIGDAVVGYHPERSIAVFGQLVKSAVGGLDAIGTCLKAAELVSVVVV